MENKFEINEKELEKVIGGLGMANPVSGLTEEEALKIAAELGDGSDMGSWTTMSGSQFLDWWRKSQKEKTEGLEGGVCGNNSVNGGGIYVNKTGDVSTQN